MEDGFPDDDRAEQGLTGLGSPHCFPHQNGERVERYSRKVFVGGLPPDIDEGNCNKNCYFCFLSLTSSAALPVVCLINCYWNFSQLYKIRRVVGRAGLFI